MQDEIRGAAKLELLNLTNNKIEYLPADIGKLRELRCLELFKNKLSTLPKEIGRLLFRCYEALLLGVLYDRGSRCSDARTVLTGNLQKLRVLNLHSNLIVDLPLEIAELGDVSATSP